jgi:hypothetical protein
MSDQTAPYDPPAPVHVHLPDSAFLPPFLRGTEVVIMVPLSARGWVTEDVGSPASLPPLGAHDVAVLLALAAAHPRTLTQEDLEDPAWTGLSVRTLRPLLRRLRTEGLTDRPLGDKGGETITPRGRFALACALRTGMRPG